MARTKCAFAGNGKKQGLILLETNQKSNGYTHAKDHRQTAPKRAKPREQQYHHGVLEKCTQVAGTGGRKDNEKTEGPR